MGSKGVPLVGVRGQSPICVKLAPHWVANVRSLGSSGMCEIAMDVGFCLQQRVEPQRSDDREHEVERCGVLDAPERGDIGGAEQLLRGKIPGIPG